MNALSIPRRWFTGALLCIGAMVSVPQSASAQLIAINLNGYIESTASEFFPMGSHVRFNFTLPAPPWGYSIGPGSFAYPSVASAVSVGGRDFPLVANLPYLGGHGRETQPDGISATWHHFLADGFSFEINLASWDADVTTADGFLRPGISLDQFGEHGGTFFIDGGIARDVVAGFSLTSYSIRPVPEPSTYGALGGLGLIVFATFRIARTRAARGSAQVSE